MRTVFIPPLASSYSVLGFGCASLGSRASPSEGQRALSHAFERGVTWYDVAPPYGDGRAEALLGTFLAGKRDRVAICTKAGIPRSAPSWLKRMLRPAARFAVTTFPTLRKGIAQLRGPHLQVNMPPQAVEASVIESLRQLRTDYIDVLALHDPAIAMCTDPAILETLEGFVKKGYVRCVSIAGSPDAAIAGSAHSHLFQFAQFQDNPFLGVIDRLRADPATQNKIFVTHSVFGASALQRLSELQTQANSSKPPSPGEILFDYALAKNPTGIVLSSMFSPKHIDANCTRAAAPISQDVIATVKNLMEPRTF